MQDVTAIFLRDPIRFLRKVPCDCASEFKGLQTLNVQILYEGVREDSGFARMLPAPGGEAGVLFYVLGWMAEKSSVGQLGDGRRFFFTGPLSGCTFAVDKNWYTPRVVHVNKTLATGAMNVNGMMAKVNSRMGASTSILKPWQSGPNITVVESHNRNPGYVYNIFGILADGGWTFYQQEVEIRGLADRVVRGLHKLDTWF